MYKKILVPLDGSQLAECALNHVKQLFKDGPGGEVVLLNAVVIDIPWKELNPGEEGHATAFDYHAFAKSFIDKSKRYLAKTKSRLAAAGIKAKLNVVEWAVSIEKLYKAQYQIMSFGIGPQIDPNMAYMYLKYNGFDEQYPRVKEILAAASKTMDFDTRRKLYEEAHTLTYEGVPAVILYHYDYVNAYWNYVKGYKLWSSQPRFWGVWLDK